MEGRRKNQAITVVAVPYATAQTGGHRTSDRAVPPQHVRKREHDTDAVVGEVADGLLVRGFRNLARVSITEAPAGPSRREPPDPRHLDLQEQPVPAKRWFRESITSVPSTPAAMPTTMSRIRARRSSRETRLR